MKYQVTVRYRSARQRYHTLVVEGADAATALRAAADEIPSEIAPHVDLVELRVAIDPDRREYVVEESGD
jgi:hypothetical protein